MELKITSSNGCVIVTTRDQEHRFEGKIKHISSTEPQPYIAANFNSAGVLVGGQTMQEYIMKNLISKAREKGYKIEGEVA